MQSTTQGGPFKPIVRRCIFCQKIVTILAPVEGFDNWEAGEHIQTALPMLTADEREMLISGVCGECFDAACDEENFEDEE